jgi:dihydrofolate synthase/folylpolyglutamate synthase
LVAQYGAALVPSFFEALIAMAILWFHDQRVEVAVFEAGVGGYYDATSRLAGEVSAITSIELDHQKLLGESRAAIAADKAGIATAGTHLILGPDISPALRAVIEKDARAREVTVRQADFEGLHATLGDLDHPTLIALDRGGKRLSIKLPLLGRHQVSNFATVAAIARRLAQQAFIGGSDCLEGVEQTRWAGRLEARQGKPRIILDAAHNEHGMRSLVASLDGLVPYAERILLYGASQDKDYGSCLAHLAHLAPQTYLVEGFYRAAPASLLAAKLPEACGYVQSFHTPQQALEFFINHTDFSSSTLTVTGSIFMVGQFRAGLDASRVAHDAARHAETTPTDESA